MTPLHQIGNAGSVLLKLVFGIALVLISIVAIATAGSDDRVMFSVTVKTNGVVTDSSSVVTSVGTPVTVPLSDGMSVEAFARPEESDGQSWTQIRVTYLDTADSKLVHEMAMRLAHGRAGSFDYVDPSHRHEFAIAVKDAR